MEKNKMVKSYDVWNSGGNIYVMSGQLTDGTWFLGNFGGESIISIYKTEDVMMESMYGDGFIRHLSPRNPLSKQIYREVFETEDAEAKEGKFVGWYVDMLERVMQEYEELMKDDELLNELDVWEVKENEQNE